MTQEDKDLLLKDLCTRLPYNVRVEYNGTTFSNIFDVLGIAHGRIMLCLPFMSKTECPLIGEVKPYLFPMSSMTEEQKNVHDTLVFNINFIESGRKTVVRMLFEFYLKNHIDYNGLIEKGLANDATGLNIY